MVKVRVVIVAACVSAVAAVADGGVACVWFVESYFGCCCEFDVCEWGYVLGGRM